MRTFTPLLPLLHKGLVTAEMGLGAGTGLIPSSQLAKALNNPNATGHFDINGYNITGEYPWEKDSSTRAIDGWSLDFNITAAVSTANSTDTMLLPSDGFVAAASLRIHPPPSMMTKDKDGNTKIAAHSSWRGCITVLANNNLPGYPQDLVDRGKTDDGSCKTMLGDECRRAIEGEWGHDGDCGIPDLPKACHSVFGAKHVSASSMSLSFNQQNLDSINLVEWSSALFKTNTNTSHYDILGQAHPVIITWGFNQTQRKEHSLVYLPMSTVTCVRATRAVDEKSVVPNADFGKEDEKKDDDPLKGTGGQGDDKKGNENGAGREVGAPIWGMLVGVVSVGLLFSEL